MYDQPKNVYTDKLIRYKIVAQIILTLAKV